MSGDRVKIIVSKGGDEKETGAMSSNGDPLWWDESTGLL
jgi:hypothetical protein